MLLARMMTFNFWYPILIAGVIWPTVFTYGPVLEGQLNPVLTDLKFTSVEQNDDYTLIGGTMVKRRDCPFVKMEWFYGDTKRYSLAPVELTKAPALRELGPFSFGPWKTLLSPTQLYNNSFALAYHRCHPLWDTVTKIYP